MLIGGHGNGGRHGNGIVLIFWAFLNAHFAMEKLEIVIKSSVLDRPRILMIDPEYLSFDDNDLANSESTRFEKEDIIGIRYWVKGISGYTFNIGRIYCVDIRSETGKVIKIRLKSIYGIRVKKLEAKFNEIVNAIIGNYFQDLIQHYLNLFANKLPFEVLGVAFSQKGLVFRSEEIVIPWSDVGARFYNHYFTLFKKSDPYHYRTFSYLEEWNTHILYIICESILEEKKVRDN
jgi:hypothetical protein